MTKAFLLLVPTLIASASGDTHLAPVAEKPVKGTTPNLDPATQSEIDDKRRHRVIGATSEYATEERGLMATAGDELKSMEQPLIAKLVENPGDGFIESLYSKLRNYLGTASWNQPVETRSKLEIAKDMIKRDASHNDLYQAGITNEVYRQASIDSLNVKSATYSEDKKQVNMLCRTYENFRRREPHLQAAIRSLHRIQ